MFASPQFAQIICFLLCCLQMNLLHWWHFIDAGEFFCRPHMKQLSRFFDGLPAMPSPSSSTGSGRYFSRNAETPLGSEGIWGLETRCSFIRLNDRFFKKTILSCGSSDGVLRDGVYHPRTDACNFHKNIKYSKRPSPCDTRDEIRSTHLVTCPRHSFSYYSPG